MPTKFSSIIGASHLHRSKRGGTRKSRNAAGRATNVTITRFVDRYGNEWKVLTSTTSVTRELVGEAK